MFLLFVLLIHVPGVVAHPRDRIFWIVMLRDLAFAGGALALTGDANRQAGLDAANRWIVLGVCVLPYL
jgi:hypothetical protein